MKVLVTGATGFVGGPVCRALLARGHEVVAAVRRAENLTAGVEPRLIGEIGPLTEWAPALASCEVVVHLAARAHVMNDTVADPLAVFRRVNRDGAVRLAEQAVAAGVRRMVFVSSVKVLGESTTGREPFRADEKPAPQDPYGVSKMEAEQALAALADATRLELAIIRPPLVHGPGAKGNLALLLRLLATRMPLPLGLVANRRSLVGVDNLADAIAFLAERSDATGSFMVRDGDDISTPDLLRLLGHALGRSPVLLPVPIALMRFAARLVGKGAVIERLTGSLTVDDGELRALGWRPPVSLEDGLKAMVSR